MRVSLIVTVKNESSSLPTLLDSIAAQTRPPDEIIICDGGSRDNTPELLHRETRMPIRVIERPGSTISQGRNAAIAMATGDVIASTDAGVRLEPEWLEKITAPYTASEVSVVSGFFLPDVHTPFEIAMGATVLPRLADIDPPKFLPSSRSVAFTKAAWQSVGGYPEWLDYCEDLVFDFALREKYGAFAFAPEAIAHFKPRSSLRAFLKQYYLYARGDGKANLWLKRHLIRYATYLIALPLGAMLSSALSPWFLGLGVIGATAYLKRPYQRLIPMLRGQKPSGQIKAIGWVPIIRVAGDIAKMTGYPVGVWWRKRNPISR